MSTLNEGYKSIIPAIHLEEGQDRLLRLIYYSGASKALQRIRERISVEIGFLGKDMQFVDDLLDREFRDINEELITALPTDYTK